MSSEDEYEEVSEDFDDEEFEEEQKIVAASGQNAPKRPAVYDIDALHEKLEDISWTQEVPWEETLAITSSKPALVSNIDDDIERELVFYKQALEASLEAIKKFEGSNTPWLRPTDYYAEMVKSDQHMNEVKKQLMFQQSKIEDAEQRRKQREQKMYNKQVQLEKQKQRNQDKKRQVEQISKLRKQRQNSGFAGELDVDAEISNMDKPSHKPAERLRKDGPVSKKREFKNTKFGFGGRKRGSKQNDATSAAAFDSVRPGKFKDQYTARAGGRGRGGAGGRGRGGVSKVHGKPRNNKQRPGKQRRQKGKQ